MSEKEGGTAALGEKDAYRHTSVSHRSCFCCTPAASFFFVIAVNEFPRVRRLVKPTVEELGPIWGNHLCFTALHTKKQHSTKLVVFVDSMWV